MSLGQDARWRARLVQALGLTKAARVLDLGCGTGDVAMAIAEEGGTPVGLDPSREMLRRARAKAPDLAWVQGDALHLPFKDLAFEGSTSAFVLRNLPERPAAFREQARVLAKGGVAAHLELVRPPRGAKRAFHTAYVSAAVPLLGLLSSNRRAYRYLADTVLQVPQPERFADELGLAGLKATHVERMALDGVALITGRRG